MENEGKKVLLAVIEAWWADKEIVRSSEDHATNLLDRLTTPELKWAWQNVYDSTKTKETAEAKS